MESKYVEKYINFFTGKAQKAVQYGNFDKACMAGRISAEIQYQWNQTYVDENLEKCITIMAQKKKTIIKNYQIKDGVILFYDGFGLDTRGLALIYVKALCDLGYTVVYVVPENARHRQPEIQRVTAGKEITFCYLQNSLGNRHIDDILQIFVKYQPEIAFFYTWPADIEACVAFEVMEGKVKRYQINLTDHAFWLGRDAFDYCVEFREYGACVSYLYRKIPEGKICLLHYYPYFDKDIPFKGLPFEVKNRPILFSGGSLYKTFDDKGTYYEIVEKIMQRHDDLLFVYAGNGDRSGLKKLQEKLSGRVYPIDERKDLYAVMQQCTLYLNTYPMIGGLMTQYAAIAGRLPLTLVNCQENSLDGLLLNHENINIEFNNKDDLIDEADKLLSDDNYRWQMESKLENSVVDESKFKQELSRLLKSGKTDFSFELRNIDTSEFRKSYIHRFNMNNLATAIINKKTTAIWWKYPRLLCYRILHKFFL